MWVDEECNYYYSFVTSQQFRETSCGQWWNIWLWAHQIWEGKLLRIHSMERVSETNLSQSAVSKAHKDPSSHSLTHTHTLPPCSGCRLMRFEVFLLFSTSSPDGPTFGLVISVHGPLKFSSGTVWHHHFKDKLASCDVLTCENKYATFIQPELPTARR